MEAATALRRVADIMAVEITSTLLESDQACPMGVRIFSRPGPVMVKHTPGLLVAPA
jgi:hypothetical protein